jgi:hypothetical protein
MLRVNAVVYFRTVKEGGHPRAWSGIQPSLEVGGKLIACKVVKGDEGTALELGILHEVAIELGYGEMYEDHLRTGLEFRLMVASWEIGHGRIV